MRVNLRFTIHGIFPFLIWLSFLWLICCLNICIFKNVCTYIKGTYFIHLYLFSPTWKFTSHSFNGMFNKQCFLKYLFIYLFLEREEWKDRGRETSMCGCFSNACYWGPDLARNWGMWPDWELNLRLFGLQASAQSTEPHKLGLVSFILMKTKLIFPLWLLSLCHI